MIKKQKYVHDFVTGIVVPQIEMNLTSVQVQGGIRPLHTTWTPELAQDLTAYHNIDAEAELTDLLSENIAREIDNEILANIREMVPIEVPDPIRPRTGRLLTSNEVGNTHGFRTQQEIRQQTINNWDNLGFLDGLEGHVRPNIAQLFESQASTLLNEVPEPENGFDTAIFPIVRRVHPQLLANDIVAVQPMNLPLGDLHYLTPEIGYNHFHHNLGGNHDLPQGVEVNWRTNDTWTYENLYGSRIGVSMEMKKHEFVINSRIRSIFDQVES
jgi:hypothetical protein